MTDLSTHRHPDTDITTIKKLREKIAELAGEILHVRGDHVRCPKCGELYILEQGRMANDLAEFVQKNAPPKQGQET
jgi:hypothetical protein